MHPKLHFVSGASLVDIIYRVYVDIKNFFTLWVHCHYYVSLLQQVNPTLTNG